MPIIPITMKSTPKSKTSEATLPTNGFEDRVLLLLDMTSAITINEMLKR
jgi:hypothetical protein